MERLLMLPVDDDLLSGTGTKIYGVDIDDAQRLQISDRTRNRAGTTG